MAFSDYIKVRCLEIYHQTNSVEQAIALIHKEYGVLVAERTVYDWIEKEKKSKINTEDTLLQHPPQPGVQVNIQNNIKLAEERLKLDKEKAVKLYNAIFSKSMPQMVELLKEAMKELSPQIKKRKEEIEAMSIREVISLVRDITNLQKHNFSFVLDLLAKTNPGNDDDLNKIADTFKAALTTMAGEDHGG